MARTPSPEELDRINQQNLAEITAKVATQEKDGKSFKLSADGHGPGVIPEAIWQQHKTKQIAEDAEAQS